jgi:hypothetical protein
MSSFVSVFVNVSFFILFSQFAQSRVPLPPVPELDRSDHERESMSPVPESRNLRPKPKSLPSPLVTPIQGSI